MNLLSYYYPTSATHPDSHTLDFITVNDSCSSSSSFITNLLSAQLFSNSGYSVLQPYAHSSVFYFPFPHIYKLPCEFIFLPQSYTQLHTDSLDNILKFSIPCTYASKDQLNANQRSYQPSALSTYTLLERSCTNVDHSHYNPSHSLHLHLHPQTCSTVLWICTTAIPNSPVS